jgi:hypothetical protein
LNYRFSFSGKKQTRYLLWEIMQICWNMRRGRCFVRHSAGGGTHFLYPSATTLYSRKLLCWYPGQSYVCREVGDRLKASSAHNDLLFVTRPMHLNLIGISTAFLRKCSCIYYSREAARPLDLRLEIRLFCFSLQVTYQLIDFFRPTRNLNLVILMVIV